MRQLASFLERVQMRVDRAICVPHFHADQHELLSATVRQYRPYTKKNPLDDPIALLYLITQAWGRRLDAQVERVAAFCSLYLLAADLLDDVQDQDLAGKPHAAAGPAVASNNAVALLFLALKELHESLELEPCEGQRRLFLELFDRISLLCVSGQHRDLTQVAGARTPAEVLEMQMAKTASVSLVVECGALLARCGAQALLAYRELGKHLAGVVQVRDDLRDVFGKSDSPDLRSSKSTYPIACFFERAGAEQQSVLNQLLGELPESLDRLRELLYDSGAVAEAAAAIEANRCAVHERIASTGNEHAAHRTLLDMTDAVAQSVYVPPPLTSSAGLYRPRGTWHERVREAQSLFVRRMAFLDPPTPPVLRPWHAAPWMYVPEHETVFYPDIEQQGAEVLPYHAELLGLSDLNQVARVMHEQIDAVLAHEMFHFWRDASGRLTSDHWHEEWAANRLAVAYLQQFDPERLQQSVELAQSTLARFPGALDARADAVLARCHVPSHSANGYGMDLQQMALVGLELVRRLACEPLVLERVARELLEPLASSHEAA